VECSVIAAYPKVNSQRAPRATICWDPFDVAALATRELDVVRRAHWNHLREHTDTTTAKKFTGALARRAAQLSTHSALGVSVSPSWGLR
jgi:transposase